MEQKEQKVQSSIRRLPLNSTQPLNAPSYSLAGNAGSNANSGFNRSSEIGLKRNLSDKNVQQQIQRDIAEFCLSQGYPRGETLMAKKCISFELDRFSNGFHILSTISGS